MTADGAAAFRALHHGRAAGDPLVLPGPWDAASARVFADAGFAALATPSAGLSAALGYPDGEGTPPAEMFAAIGRIVRAVDVPVSADLEAGYGLPPRELAERLLAAGAVGCNLEDSDPATGRLADPRRHADRLAEVRAAAGESLLVNARIDVFLRAGPRPADPARAAADDAAALAAAVDRALLYTAAGAECVYPILAPPAALTAFAAALAGVPVNALRTPGGPGPRGLGALGATRVTFGGGLQARATAAVAKIAEGLRDDGW